MTPPRLHLVGRQDAGKTTLLVELVAELRRRGLRPGTVKHSGHRHDLDTPGKDSHRHRAAGAIPAAILTPELGGIFFPLEAGADPYQRIAPLYSGCDLVLVEGDAGRDGLKVEVWREGCAAPLASAGPGIAALISDDDPACATGIPRWPRRDLPELADRLLELLARQPGAEGA